MSSFDQSQELFLKTLFVKNFRNLSELSLTFGPRHNLFIGQNGQGKTNCLESIALACSLRPLQALQNIDLIKFHEPCAKIIAHFDGDQNITIDVDIMPDGKKAKINDQSLKKTSQLANSIPLVSFIPAELNLVAGGQSLRRRALDQAAAALFAEHLLALKSYEKLLCHRNRLLKEWPLDRELLATFTDMLVAKGAHVMFFRLKAIHHLLELFTDTLKKILGPGHQGSIVYQTNHQTITNHTAADLVALLNHDRALMEKHEHKRKVTMFGPHLDDMLFELNGANAKTSASRGQTRAIVFSFKLAQMMAINRIRGCSPIVILDDIVSELDELIKSNLIETIDELKTQAFFSTTDLTTFSRHVAPEHIFSMSAGHILSR